MKTNLPARMPAKIPAGDQLVMDLLKAAMQYVNDPRARLSRSDRGFANLTLLGVSLLYVFSD